MKAWSKLNKQVESHSGHGPLDCNMYDPHTTFTYSGDFIEYTNQDETLSGPPAPNHKSFALPWPQPSPPPLLKVLTLTNRTTGSLRAPPTKLCTTPLEPLTRPLLALRVRISITWAPTFSSTMPLACTNSPFLISLPIKNEILDKR